MKKRIIFSLISSVFLFFCLVAFAPVAMADIEPVSVELSLQQTLALFGTEFYGMGYTSNNGVSRIPFKFLCTSDQLRDLQHLTFWNYYDGGGSLSATDALVDSYNGQEFLVYACDATLINNSSNLFTVYTPFTIDLENIQFYRQRFWFSSTRENSRGIYASSLEQYRSTIQLTSSNSASAYSQKTELFGSVKEPNNDSTLTGFPLMWTNLNKFGSYMLGQALDLYYHPTGENGVPINFDVNGIDIYFKNIKRYGTPSTIADWFGVDYQGDNPVANALLTKDVFFLYVAPPVISEGFVLPDNSGGSGTSPDYTEQIDNIYSNTSQISANLAAILAKLDLIYQRMTGTVSISSSSIDAIVNGVKGLFVPSQSALTEWRANMNTWLQSNMNPLYSMEQIRDSVFDSLYDVTPVGYVDLPLLDLTGEGVNFQLTANEFSDFDVVDDKVRVPLKVNDSRWNFFYELVAWGIDVVCTLAFINMCINKLHSFFMGDKVVELQDDN